MWKYVASALTRPSAALPLSPTSAFEMFSGCSLISTLAGVRLLGARGGRKACE